MYFYLKKKKGLNLPDTQLLLEVINTYNKRACL